MKPKCGDCVNYYVGCDMSCFPPVAGRKIECRLNPLPVKVTYNHCCSHFTPIASEESTDKGIDPSTIAGMFKYNLYRFLKDTPHLIYPVIKYTGIETYNLEVNGIRFCLMFTESEDEGRVLLYTVCYKEGILNCTDPGRDIRDVAGHFIGEYITFRNSNWSLGDLFEKFRKKVGVCFAEEFKHKRDH